jgi:hypothetical protein
MENIDALLRSSVRVDAATNKGSVLDVIALLTEDKGHASRDFNRLLTANPDLRPKWANLQINGKAPLTPVADAATLVEIVFVTTSTHQSAPLARTAKAR